MSTHSRGRAILPAITLAILLGFMAGAESGAQVTGTTWKPIGPAPLMGFFAGGVVGRATSIALNPFNGDQVWLGTASGGIWYSPDGAVSWYPMTDDQPALAIGDIALRGCDATGCIQVLAGTGENAIRRDTYYGRGFLVGMLQSSGSPPVYSWLLHDGTPGADFRLGSINDVVTDPSVAGGGPIYVTLSSGVTASATESTLTAPEPPVTGYGIFRTLNTGLNWTKLPIPVSQGAVPTDLEMHPDHNQILFAGFMGLGIFKTSDGGSSWCPLGPGVDIPPECTPTTWHDPPTIPFDFVEIAIAPGNPQVMYATLGHCPDQLAWNGLPSVYRSEDGGETWVRRIEGEQPYGGSDDVAMMPYGYSRYTHALTVHPTDPDEAYIGGVRLFRTQDGFGSVQLIDENKAKGISQWESETHHDHHDVVFDPTDPTRIYNTNDGGVYVTTNPIEGWIPRNSYGLQITGFHSLTLGPGFLIGGAQDNGILLYDGVHVWESENLAGDGGFTVVDAADPNRWYALTNKGKLHSTPNQGGSWCEVNYNLPDTYNPPPEGEERSFYTPFIQDPSPPHDVYWGGQSLYRSPRGIGSECGGDIYFSQISPILEWGAQPEVIGGLDVISAVAVAPSNGNRVYFGYYGGGIYRTDAACNEPTCWTDIGAGLPDVPITRIAVHPVHPGTVMVTLSGFDEVAKVWKTTENGDSWVASSTGLPTGVPANTIHYEPGFPDRLWLGMDGNPTGSSVFKSVDGGATWHAWGFNLPNVPVYDMAFHEGTAQIFLGTHGRGAFSLGGGQVTKKVVWKDLSIQAIAANGTGFEPDSDCSVEVELEDGTSCASGSTDAMGAAIRTDSHGRLVTHKEGFYTDRPMAWACFDDSCAGGGSIDDCQDPANPPVRTEVNCGATTHFVDLDDPPVGAAPRPVHLGVLVDDESSGGSFDLVPTIYSADGATRALCTVHVDVLDGDDTNAILARAETAVNTSASCQEAGVVAALSHGGDMLQEDDFPRADTFYLLALEETGTQLVPAIHAAPGDAQDLCFSLFNLRQAVTGHSQPLTFEILTGPDGALGGGLRLVQDSPFGTCSIAIATVPGENGFDLAPRLGAAFQAVGIPGPNPDCPADGNVRDVIATDDTLSMLFASDVRICTSDAGVGFLMLPDGTSELPPAAVPNVPSATECTGTDGATVLLDGRGSTDPDSTPGTNDDIVLFEWFEDFGLASEEPLGQRDSILVPFSLGEHAVSLRVTDSTAFVDRREVLVRVEDTTPPAGLGSGAPDTLFPPNHEMIPIVLDVAASDLCSSDVAVGLFDVVSSEPDDAPGSQDGATTDDVQNALIGSFDLFVDLRAERDSSGVGRTYTLTYAAEDGSGNISPIAIQVSVPLDQGGIVEPLMLSAHQSEPGLWFDWAPVSGTGPVSYNVVRGELGNITELSNSIDMGPVEWTEQASPDASTVSDPDPDDPVSGQVYFYLAEYVDDLGGHGYSTLGLKPRQVSPPGLKGTTGSEHLEQLVQPANAATRICQGWSTVATRKS